MKWLLSSWLNSNMTKEQYLIFLSEIYTNCHRFMHHGLGKEKREELITLYEDRAERYSKCGINLDRAEFLARTEVTYRFSF